MATPMPLPDPRGQSAGDEFVQGGLAHNMGDTWRPPTAVGTSNGNGGGGSMLERRVDILETHVSHIQNDVGTIKDDIRDLRNYGLAILTAVAALIGGIYLYADNKTDALTDNVNSLHIKVVEEFGAVENDINILKSQSESMVQKIDNLSDKINKLVSTGSVVNKD